MSAVTRKKFFEISIFCNTDMCAQCDPGMKLGEDNHVGGEFTLQIAMLMDLVILASVLLKKINW